MVNRHHLKRMNLWREMTAVSVGDWTTNLTFGIWTAAQINLNWPSMFGMGRANPLDRVLDNLAAGTDAVTDVELGPGVVSGLLSDD